MPCLSILTKSLVSSKERPGKHGLVEYRFATFWRVAPDATWHRRFPIFNVHGHSHGSVLLSRESRPQGPKANSAWTAIPMTLATRNVKDRKNKAKFLARLRAPPMKELLFPAITLSIGLDFLDILFTCGSWPCRQVEQFCLADLLTMVFNQLITGTILQVDQVYTYRNAIRKPPEWWRTMAAMTWFS